MRKNLKSGILEVVNIILDNSKKELAILSRFPIIAEEAFLLPNPKLEIDRSDGTRWTMFDKGAQKVTLDLHGQRIIVVNLHYFPFHHFGRKASDEDFAAIRKEFVEILLADATTPVTVTGDFNNKGLPLPTALPELFAEDRFREAVVADTTVIGLHEQFDHILYTPTLLSCLSGFAVTNHSDHYAVIDSREQRRRDLSSRRLE